jgi:Ion channel
MAIVFTFAMCMFLTFKIDNSFFLTIGYGDFYPATEAGRPIFIVYALLAVPTMTIVGTSLSRHI